MKHVAMGNPYKGLLSASILKVRVWWRKITKVKTWQKAVWVWIEWSDSVWTERGTQGDVRAIWIILVWKVSHVFWIVTDHRYVYTLAFFLTLPLSFFIFSDFATFIFNLRDEEKYFIFPILFLLIPCEKLS